MITLQTFKEHIVEDAASPNQWIYRGQANTEWNLVTSYSRFCNKYGINFSLIRFFEFLEKFTEQASDFIGNDLTKLSVCEKIALAQHYGLPTPFLDWTESPYIAMYFALSEKLKNPSPSPFRIWALSIEKLRNDNFNLKEVELSDPLVPFRWISGRLMQSKRLNRQLGSFTFLGLGESLNIYAEKRFNSVKLKSYDINGKNWIEIFKELRLMGIKAGTLFDSLDGVALDTISKEL